MDEENGELTADSLAAQLTDLPDEQPQNEDSAGEELDIETTDEAEEADESDDSDESDTDEQPDEPDSADDFEEWEQDGEKIRVTKDELKKGYLRQKDYTQKTQQFANERQAIQQRIQAEFTAVQSLAGEYGQLANIDNQIQQYQSLNWQQLRDADPITYSTALAEYNNLRSVRDDAARAISSKQQYMQQQSAQQFAEQTKEAAEHLKKVIPNFSKQHVDAMKSYGAAKGFSAEELAQVSDKRMLEVLYEAAQWRALKAKKPAIDNKVKAVPTKATKQGTQSAPTTQLNIQKNLKRVQQTGNVKDFAALLGSAQSIRRK